MTIYESVIEWNGNYFKTQETSVARLNTWVTNMISTLMSEGIDHATLCNISFHIVTGR